MKNSVRALPFLCWPGEDSRGQPKGRVVGPADHFFLRIKGQDGHDRAENLLLHTGHVICAVIWGVGGQDIKRGLLFAENKNGLILKGHNTVGV